MCRNLIHVQTNVQREALATPAEAVETVLVSRAKAKKLRAEQIKSKKELLARKRDAAKSAADIAVDTVCSEVAELEIEGEEVIPFSVHDSHRELVQLGGFLGCLRCGRYASRSGDKNRLSQACRESCPQGSRGATQRMLRGLHPEGSKGEKWPDGSSNPLPKKVRFVQKL